MGSTVFEDNNDYYKKKQILETLLKFCDILKQYLKFILLSDKL